MTNINIVDIIFRFMSLKGIGTVQTNKFILSVQGYDNIVEVEQQATAILNNKQIHEFETKIDVVANLNATFPVAFISLLDDDYPFELKKF